MGDFDYDHFRLSDRYDYTQQFGFIDNRDEVRADWVSSAIDLQLSRAPAGVVDGGPER